MKSDIEDVFQDFIDDFDPHEVSDVSNTNLSTAKNLFCFDREKYTYDGSEYWHRYSISFSYLDNEKSKFIIQKRRDVSFYVRHQIIPRLQFLGKHARTKWYFSSAYDILYIQAKETPFSGEEIKNGWNIF